MIVAHISPVPAKRAKIAFTGSLIPQLLIRTSSTVLDVVK
jgi:hypothetical protein